MISVTVEKHVGSQWKLTPEPNTPHIINMIDDSLREHRAFDMVVPQGEFIVAYNQGTNELSNKCVKRIKKAVKSAAIVLDKKHQVIFSLGN